ncbi:hypothetical protein Q3G72_007824 [Acer saccharum]|nr:hypothetical protein Q3G72_007824 [Acer saccharum]
MPTKGALAALLKYMKPWSSVPRNHGDTNIFSVASQHHFSTEEASGRHLYDATTAFKTLGHICHDRAGYNVKGGDVSWDSLLMGTLDMVGEEDPPMRESLARFSPFFYTKPTMAHDPEGRDCSGCALMLTRSSNGRNTCLIGSGWSHMSYFPYRRFVGDHMAFSPILTDASDLMPSRDSQGLGRNPASAQTEATRVNPLLPHPPAGSSFDNLVGDTQNLS